MLCNDIVCIGSNKNRNKTEYVTFVEQYVQDIRDFSSQYGSDISISYTAYNIAGNPRKFPDYGDFPQSFVMRTYGKWWDKAPSKLSDYMPQNNSNVVSHDYIDIEYHREVYPIRVSIFETYNPGSVVAIWAQDSNSQWFRLWKGPPQNVPHKSRIFSPPLQLCDFKTKLLRLEFNHSLLEYYTAIDAVLLIGTSELIIPFDGFYNQNISNVLQELACLNCNNNDVHNLTPNCSKVNEDIAVLKKKLDKYCRIYKSEIIGNATKGKLIGKLGLYCHCIPPIEEAFNSLQQFLQEDFPRLTNEIRLLSSQLLPNNTMDLKELKNCIEEIEEDTNGYFSILPDETVLKILGYLDLASLCRLCGVNKYFNNIARDALLYTNLNLKPYWHCLDTPALKSLIPRCTYLQRVDFSWVGSYDKLRPDDVIHFLRVCGSNLTHLRLNCCQFINNAVIIEIGNICRKLRELCLRCCLKVTRNGFAHLKYLKSLEHVEFYRTLIETSSLCAIIRNNPGLRHLNVAGTHDMVNMDEVAIELGRSCFYLESVDFWKAPTLTPRGVKALANCTNLREIDLGWCIRMGIPSDSLIILLSSCQLLEKVFLAAIRGLSDRDLEPLLKCKNLEQLDLLGARSLTPDIFYRIFVSCTKLQMVDLSFCEGIKESKVKEWQLQFPHISIKRSFQANCF